MLIRFVRAREVAVKFVPLWFFGLLCLTQHARAAEPMPAIRIVVVGDSTVSTYRDDPSRPPLAGWGQVLGESLTDRAEVVNLAASGRSSKSFIKEDRWTKALEQRPNYVLIQFGHNDCPGKGDRTTDPNGDFRDYLRTYISDSRKINAKPVLITPVARRTFADGKITSTLIPYAEAMIAVGQSENVPVVDLHTASVELFNRLGDEASADLNNAPEDRTHFSPKGARVMAALILTQLPKVEPSLAAYVKQPATENPASNPADRERQPNVPTGKVTSGVFADSAIFPGTRRDYSVYVPAQYSAETPACLMVFMDGAGYLKPDGAFRVPVVFDNLIHQKAMPVTIGVFVNPGTIPATKSGAKDRSNRSFEYDSMGDCYARFLLEEFLPVALKDLNVSPDPKHRAVCGISSGGICAFTVAWEKPGQFGKVLSHIGSFTNIRDGWAYPGLVRKSKPDPKPIKVYLQDGKDDLNNLFGNWPLANEDLAVALKFAGYEHQFVMTDGGHSGNWAGEQLPAALRWLWSDQVK
jgi:lysophospholipase L1-like esterase/enterochelin esterase-like enzyme